MVAGCQAPSLPCPDNYPITLRDFSGNREGCRVLNAGCPTPYIPLYGYFTNLSPNTLTVTNCWKSLTSCSVVLDNAALPAGSGGAYGKQIVTFTPLGSPTGVESLVGCIINSATVCPTDFPFRFIDFSGTVGANAPPTTAKLDKCAPSNALTSCPSYVAPQAGQLPSVYWKPGYTKSALTACIKYYIAPGAYSTTAAATTNPLCPPDYPTVAITQFDPLMVTGQEQVVGCYTSDSYCRDHVPNYGFTLIPGSPLPNYCSPQIIGLQTCGGYPGKRGL
jgi:hypothetical protein